MASIQGEHRRRMFYGNARTEREKDREPKPVAALRKKHLNDKQELIAKHQKESATLAAEIHKARSTNYRVLNSGGHPSDQLLEQEKKRTSALEATHHAALKRLAQDHRAAMDTAIAKHPIEA